MPGYNGQRCLLSAQDVRKRGMYLTSPSAKHLPKPFRPLDKSLVSNDNAPHGGTDTFCQAKADRVKAGAVLFEIDSFGSYGIKEPCPVQVHCDGLLAIGNGEAAYKL